MHKSAFSASIVFVAVASLSSLALADIEKGELFISPLKIGDGIYPFYLAPENEVTSSLIYCFRDEAEAKRALTEDPLMGGIVLLPGSTMYMKNDGKSTTHIKTGAIITSEFFKVECAE